MDDNTFLERMSAPVDGARDLEPQAESHERMAERSNVTDGPEIDEEIDIVDFQSMQSFPASDPPVWGSHRIVVDRANEPDTW